jgi:hypothetical protein
VHRAFNGPKRRFPFRAEALSPAIDAAVGRSMDAEQRAVYLTGEDFTGRCRSCSTRPVGAGPDIGASEYDSGTPMRIPFVLPGPMACGAGTRPSEDHSECVECDAGWYSTIGICQECALNLGFAVSADKSACQPPFGCNAGTACPADAECTEQGDCAECPAGSVSLGKAPCAECSLIGDNQKANPVQTACTACGAGTRPSEDHSECVECDAGWYSTIGICQECALNLGFAVSADKSACQCVSLVCIEPGPGPGPGPAPAPAPVSSTSEIIDCIAPGLHACVADDAQHAPESACCAEEFDASCARGLELVYQMRRDKTCLPPNQVRLGGSFSARKFWHRKSSVMY